MEELYDMIFKRKSMRRFDDNLAITNAELKDINIQLEALVPLQANIKVKFKIVKRTETTATRGEYCLLMYSESKKHYLLNAGYLLEQIDLYLATKDIGVCWYGVSKTNELQYEGLNYVIMLAFGKSQSADFRRDYTKCTRLPINEIWQGEFYSDVRDVVRYAPSACNTQPWMVMSENESIKIYRRTITKCFFPIDKLPYFNTIDIGVFMCFLEITLHHKGYGFNQTLKDMEREKSGLTAIANYIIRDN